MGVNASKSANIPNAGEDTRELTYCKNIWA